MRIGIGHDIHRLVPGRQLILGGVDIPFRLGLEGHSDADVLCHALCDALIGAAAQGDIGRHFPNSDPAYKDISGLVLLRRVLRLIRRQGYGIVNLDATIIAEKPKLSRHIRKMRRRIASALEIDIDRINVKAGTHEGLGSLGQGLGIACHAVAMIKPLEE